MMHINYPQAPVMEKVQDHVGEPLAISTALVVSTGTCPYIWSSRLLREALAGVSELAHVPCLLDPAALLERAWATLGQG